MKISTTNSLIFFIVFTAVVSPAQQWQWAKGITLPGNPYIVFPQIASEPSGNFYVSCASWDQNTGNPAGSCVIKYDANGNELWRRLFTEKLRIMKIQPDYFGNLLVAGDFRDTIHINGNTHASVNNDGFLMSLASASVTTWFQKIAGPGDESASDIHRDNQGNFYVTGAFTNQTAIGGTTLATSAQACTYIMKFNSSGNNLLMITTTGTASTSSNAGHRVATDNTGNVYLLGYYNQITLDTTSLYDGNPYGAQYLAKFNPAGNPLFLKHLIDGTESFTNFKFADSALYFTGSGGWTSGGWTLTRKYSTNGSLVWNKSHSGFYYEYSCNNLALSDSGFYAIGMQGNPNVPNWVTTYDLMLSHFKSDGTENCTFINSKGRVNGYDITKPSNNEYVILGAMPDTITLSGVQLTKNNGNHFIAKFSDGVFVTSEIKNQSDNQVASIVPNPSGGQFEIRFKDTVNNGIINIYDITGKCIEQKKITGATIFIELKDGAKGIYFVNIETNKGVSRQKIILE